MRKNPFINKLFWIMILMLFCTFNYITFSNFNGSSEGKYSTSIGAGAITRVKSNFSGSLNRILKSLDLSCDRCGFNKAQRCFHPTDIDGKSKIEDFAEIVRQNNGKVDTKVAYLTFDDGPSVNNTMNILDVLNKNNVKATFFVIGDKVDLYPDVVKALDESGMCIASHTYSHNYKEIYKDVESYMADLHKCNESIVKVTGKPLISYIRIPGGSYNEVSNKEKMKEIRNELIKNNISYVDWNVSIGDALGRNISPNKLAKTTYKQCKGLEYAVILMHDSYYKRTTVEALPEIIRHLKSKGFIFKTFNELTPYERRYMIREKIINKDKSK